MGAIERIWIGIFGPPKELLVDGEGGISLSDYTRTRLGRYGIKLHIRAKDQHARYAERRGALLRDAIHRIHSQLKEEGIVLPFTSVLSEATFSGNALITVGGSTPYNAVMGRMPSMLPGIEHIRSPDFGDDEPGGQGSEYADLSSEGKKKKGSSTLEHTHRLREIAIQEMTEASARARLGRALNTRSTPAAQKMNLQVGDDVDFYKSPIAKDIPG